MKPVRGIETFYLQPPEEYRQGFPINETRSRD